MTRHRDVVPARLGPTSAAAILTFALACGHDSRPPPAVPHDPPDAARDVPTVAERPTAAERALAEKYASAIASPLGSLGPLLEESAVVAFPGFRTSVGRAEVIAVHERLFGAFDDRKLALRRVLKTARAQAVEWTFAGTMSRDWMELRATNAPVTFDGLTLLFTTDAGRLSEVHVYFDVARVKARLGQGPKGVVASAAPALPTGPPEVIEQADTAAEAQNAAVVRGQLDALETSNLQRYLGAMADDVAITTVSGPTTHGKEAARRYYQDMHAAIEQLDTTTSNLWGVGSFVVVEYTITGLQAAPIEWIPPGHDRVITMHLTDVVELSDQRVARVVRYENLAEISSEDE